MKDIDVLVAGELNPDLILSKADLEPFFGQTEILVDSAKLTVGSSSAIFACGCARLGLKTAFVGVVGDDIFGRFMLESLNERGVDTTAVIIDPKQETGLSVILNRGNDRAILTHLGAINALHIEQIPDDLLKRAKHLHIASYFLQTALQPHLYDLFIRTYQHHATSSLDTNWDPDGQWSNVARVLHAADIFFPNENEALALTSAPNLESALDRMAEYVSTVAIKCGADGAIARKGDTRVEMPAIPCKVVDTVGAGDSFDAGFIYGHLQNWDLEKTLKFAIACGSLSTRGHGGIETQASVEEALKVMSET
jgi:sugar/nucleoside kinase (ribokinase family)